MNSQHRTFYITYVSMSRQKWSEPGAKESRRDPEGSGRKKFGRTIALLY